jgi:transposase
MMLFDKFGLHQPLNRQVDRMAQEGIPFSVSTLGDMVGHCAVALQPLFDSLQAHVLAAQRLHGDDTTVPVLAKGKTTTGRLWILARDDRPFGGEAAPAAVFYYSPDRKGEHPAGHLQNWTGILQADAYAGYNALFQTTRSPGPITWAACWAHARRKFFELADIASGARKKALGKQAATISPMALEAVRRIDAIFEIERDANGLTPDQRLDMRKHFSASLVADLETWMREQRAKLSGASPVAKAMNYMLGNWAGFVRFLTDGRICLTNNAAERGMRGIAQGRKAWLFAGSDRGGQRAACIYSLIYTARLNDIDPQAWLTDVLDRIASHPAKHVHQLLPWHWKAEKAAALKAAAQSNTVAA